MENIFLKPIKDGKIRSLDELKSVYRKLMLRTHPDTVGSNRFVEQYIEYSNHYEEAKEKLYALRTTKTQKPEAYTNYRLLFYQEYYRLERIDKPYMFYLDTVNREEVELSKNQALQYFTTWKSDTVVLYQAADKMYDEIKKTKPIGPYLKDGLLYNLSPVFHNICSYQITGLQYYKKQVRQNLKGIMAQLEKREYYALKEFIRFLIDDMEHGPAILDIH